MGWHVRHFPPSPMLQQWQIRSAQTARYLQYIPMLLSVYLALKYFPYNEIQPFFKSWGYDTAFMGLASIVTVLVKSIALSVLLFATAMVGCVVLPIYLVGATTVNPLVFVLMPLIFELVGARADLRNRDPYPLLLVGLTMMGLLLVYYRGPEYIIILTIAGLYAFCMVLFQVAMYNMPSSFVDQPDQEMESQPRQGYPSLAYGDSQKAAAPASPDSGHSEFEDRFPAKSPTVTFADVVGMIDFKKRLLAAGNEVAAEIVAKPAPSTGLFKGKKKTDAELHGPLKKARNGILLFGLPGNGKTFMAEALAGELKLKMISVTFGDIASRWVGQMTEVAMASFDAAQKNAPCVMFIDEVDSILGARNDSSASHEHTRTVNAILTRLVELRGKGVVLVAATNNIDGLDTAAIREGRFDFKIEVPPPDEPARIALLERAIAASFVSADQPSIVRVAKRWKGFSVARLTAIAEEASRTSATENKPVDFLALTNALRVIQGRTGYRFTADDPVLDDLVLTPSMREALYGISDRMVHIEEIEEIGGSVPSGLLFYGPPGGGKTLAAKALAKTAQWAFLSVSGQDLMTQADKIDKTLEMAENLRPCVIMIDEADDVLGNRSMSGNTTVTNKLLAAIDGAGGKTPDVLWIAATNSPENIDAAALRGGRFTEKINFPPPDREAVIRFIEKWRGRTKAPLSAGFDNNAAADVLEGLSYANLKEILQTSVNLMVGRRATSTNVSLTLDDLAKARERIIFGEAGHL